MNCSLRAHCNCKTPPGHSHAHMCILRGHLCIRAGPDALMQLAVRRCRETVPAARPRTHALVVDVGCRRVPPTCSMQHSTPTSQKRSLVPVAKPPGNDMTAPRTAQTAPPPCVSALSKSPRHTRRDHGESVIAVARTDATTRAFRGCQDPSTFGAGHIGLT